MRNTKSKHIIIMAMIVCLVIVMCALASCSIKKKPLDPVDAETITYDGETVKWGAVDHADFYTVVVNGTSYHADDTHLPVVVKVDAAISVLAEAEESSRRYVSAETSAEVTFTAVGPTTVGIDAGYFVWQGVGGITRYVYELNGETYQGYVDAETSEETGAIEGKLKAARKEDTDTSSLRVKPVVTAPKSFGVWSDVKTVTYLANPQNIQYNNFFQKPNNKTNIQHLISWDEVKNAQGYRIEMAGDDGAKENKVYDAPKGVTQYVYHTAPILEDTISLKQKNSFWVKITAVGNGNDIIDSDTVEKSFVYIDPVSGIAMNNGVLRWNPNPNATKYDVYVREYSSVPKDDNDRNNTLKEYVYTTEKPELDSFEAGVFYSVMVKPGTLDGNAFSNWNTANDVRFYPAPVLTWTYEGETAQNESYGKVQWNSIGTSYSIEVYKGGDRLSSSKETVNNLGSTSFSTTSYDFSTANLSAGEYYLYCFVNHNADQGFSSSRYSEPLRFVILEDIDAVSFATDINTNPTIGASGMQVSGDCGVMFNIPKYATGAKIYRDETPMQVDPNMTDERFMYGFTFRFNYGDGLGNEAASNTMNVISLQSTYERAGALLIAENSTRGSKLANGKEFDVKGNYDTVILNGRTTQFQLQQLSIPTGIECKGDVITWNPVANANGYFFIFENESGVRDYGSIYGTSLAVPFNLGVGTNKFYVAAQGNGNMSVASFYSNPYYLYKLAAPTNLTIDGYYLSWEDKSPAPTTESEMQERSVKYSVEVSSRIESYSPTTLNQRLQSDDILISGTTVKVRAVAGTNSETIGLGAVVSSDYSDQILLKKLTTPQSPTITDDSITWKPVTDAGCYKLYTGDDDLVYTLVVDPTAISDPRIEIVADPTASLKPGQIYLSALYEKSNGNLGEYYVVALPDPEGEKNSVKTSDNGYSFQSEPSVHTSMRVLKAPVVEVNETTGELTWANVANAMTYCVLVRYADDQGKVSEESEISRYFLSVKKDQTSSQTGESIVNGNRFRPLIFGKDGDVINMEVYAIGDGGLTSIRSLSAFYEIDLVKHADLSAGDFEVSFSPEDEHVLIVKMTGAATAANYGVSLGGAELSFTAAQMARGAEVNVDYAGDYTVTVRALGGDNFENAKKWYLPSDSCTLTSFTVLRDLSSRFDLRLIRTESGMNIEVDPVPDATYVSYKLYYYNDRAELDDLLEKDTSDPSKETFEKVGDKLQSILIPLNNTDKKTYVRITVKACSSEDSVYDAWAYTNRDFTIA